MDRRTALCGISGFLVSSLAVGAGVSAKPRVTPYNPQEAAQIAEFGEAAPPITWMHDLKKARKISVSTGKPMLIVFGGPWCQYCKKLDKEVLGHPTVARYINTSFVPVHLDSEKDQRAAQILEVKALPTTVILNSDADLLGSIEGYVAVRDFAQVLKDSLDYHKTMQQESSGPIRQTRSNQPGLR